MAEKSKGEERGLDQTLRGQADRGPKELCQRRTAGREGKIMWQTGGGKRLILR